MEALSSLDLFLLGLIEDGIDTPYLFRERARLSVGATLPALRRLENIGLVRREAKAPRNKQRFTVTKPGKQHLRSQLKMLVQQCIDQPPADAESILRAAGLAFSVGDSKSARDCLRAAVHDRRQRRRPQQPTISPDARLSGTYSHWLSIVQTARSKAEAEALAKLLAALQGQKTKTSSKR
jgi:DNA-binding PadR family transcriptional regulator